MEALVGDEEQRDVRDPGSESRLPIGKEKAPCLGLGPEESHYPCHLSRKLADPAGRYKKKKDREIRGPSLRFLWAD